MARQYTEKDIVSIKSDRDRVRKRPTLYTNDSGAAGAIHIAFEYVDNGIDEVSTKDSIGDSVTLTYDEATHEMSIVDNGSGIPHGSLLDAYTVLSTSGKFDNDDTTAFTFSGGSFGFGAKLGTFLSKNLEVTSMRDGKYLTYKFKDGLLVDTDKGKSKEHGTITKFTLDDEFIRVGEVDPNDLKERLHEKSYCFPDLKLTFIRLNNGEAVKSVTYEGNTLADLIKKEKPDTDIIEAHADKKIRLLKTSQVPPDMGALGESAIKDIRVVVDVVLSYSEKALDLDTDKMIISYANSIKTYDGGAHVQGLKDGLVKFFREVAIPKMSKKEQENLKITPSDITSGLCAVVSVKLNRPEFSAQFKSRLTNQEAKFAVRDAVFNSLCDMKGSKVNQLVDFVKRVTRGRMASKKTRKKDVENAFSKDRSDKFTPIIYTMKTVAPELIITEGDSAGSLAVLARDANNQAVFSVRKPKNVFDRDVDIVAHDKSIFNELIDVLGVELGEKCDPTKCQFTRILGLQDGDIDGDGIFIGLAALFARYCKPLVDAGMIGRIIPPAYSFMDGKKKRFIQSKRDFFDYILKKFIKNVTICAGKHEMDKKELKEFLDMNFEYDEKLENLADHYCCSPLLMEYIAWKYHGGPKNQTKAYWTKALKGYPELKIINEDGTLIIDGDLPGFDYINLAFNESFDKHLKAFKEVQSINEVIDDYTINDKKGQTLYQVMKALRSYMPKGVERYKGLGELEARELKEYCMDPETRTVIILKFKNYEEDMKLLNVIMSSKEEYARARAELLAECVVDSRDIDT